jgi:hypothetical protein
MNNEIDETVYAEFMDYYQHTQLPNPEHYPKQFQFLIDSFLHHKKMKDMKNDQSNISTSR